LMPYLAGRTEEVQAPLFSASSPSPTGRWPRYFRRTRAVGWQPAGGRPRGPGRGSVGRTLQARRV